MDVNEKLEAVPALLNAAQILWQAHVSLGFSPNTALAEKAEELTSLALSSMKRS